MSCNHKHVVLLKLNKSMLEVLIFNRFGIFLTQITKYFYYFVVLLRISNLILHEFQYYDQIWANFNLPPT